MKKTLSAGVLLALLGACRGDDQSVAEVKKHDGDVTRDTASTQQKWEPATDGAKLAMGDGVKTGAKAEATIHLTRGGTIKLPSDTTIRFLARAPGATGPAGARLAVETGEASIEADNGELAIETTIGLAHIESGGKLRVSSGEGGTHIEVSIGAARIDTEDGGLALTPGKSFDVSVGGAILEHEIADAAVDAAPHVEPMVDAGAGSAIVASIVGKGVRVHPHGTGAAKVLSEGPATLDPTDVVDVPAGAAVDLRRGTEHGRLLGAGKYVIGNAEGGAIVRASSGKVEIEASTTDVIVEVPGGTVVAKAGGRSRVEAEVGLAGTKVKVRQGEGELRGKTNQVVRAGEGASLDGKGAVATVRAPEHADFTVRAGESVVVRDPRPPTALAFDFSALCPGAGIVTRGDTSLRGERRAAMFIPAGSHPYTIQCIGKDGVEEAPVATGTVTVIADSARAELARLPPATLVDMDGRRYTILYQNLLPSVTARWQDAPPANGFVLVVDGQRTRSETARQSLKSGAIAEGTHVIRFETEDASKRSPETTLAIKFDNAAPAVSVREPADGSFAAGDPTKVAGVVVEGWSVSVNGQNVPLDEQRRFSTTATAVPGENAIVLRLSHKQHGTVYYVRHAASARP